MRDIENFESTKLQIVIGEKPVSTAKHIKYLGIEVDQFLSWDEHNFGVTTETTETSKGIGMLRYAKMYLLLTNIQSMLRSFIEPYIRSSCSVWEVGIIIIIGIISTLEVTIFGIYHSWDHIYVRSDNFRDLSQLGSCLR